MIFNHTRLGPLSFALLVEVPWGHENCLGAAIPEEEILSRCLTPEPQGQRRSVECQPQGKASKAHQGSVWIIGDSHSFALVPCIEIPASAAGMAAACHALDMQDLD